MQQLVCIHADLLNDKHAWSNADVVTIYMYTHETLLQRKLLLVIITLAPESAADAKHFYSDIQFAIAISSNKKKVKLIWLSAKKPVDILKLTQRN